MGETTTPNNLVLSDTAQTDTIKKWLCGGGGALMKDKHLATLEITMMWMFFLYHSPFSVIYYSLRLTLFLSIFLFSDLVTLGRK